MGLMSLQMPNAPAMRQLLFSGSPYCTISHFSQYHTHVSQLPASERRKLEDAAEFVLQSYSNPLLTRGFVVAIGVRGHADQDLLKTGRARLDFEQKISEQRAEEVADVLVEAIKARAFRLLAKTILVGDPFDPIVEGVGARMLARPHPLNEQDRLLNRRVEVFFLRDASALTDANFDLPPQKRFSA